MKKVVITGATCMIGIALIEECIKNQIEILALVRKGSSKINRFPNSPYLKIAECDLEDIKTFNFKDKYDVLYHFAWSNTDKDGRKIIDKQLENIEYSIDAMRLAKRLGCKKFIGAGSQAEYGIHTEKKTSPQTPLNPIDAYGICKMTAGKLCSIEAQNLGLDFAWVRIFSLFGKYELPGTLIQNLIIKLANNEKCSLTEGVQIWDYLHVSDAGKAFYLIGDKLQGNEFFCLGSGQNKMLREYVEEMKETIGSKSELAFGEIPYENGKPNSMCADITSLQKLTGWQPTTTFAEGIRQEIQRLKI